MPSEQKRKFAARKDLLVVVAIFAVAAALYAFTKLADFNNGASAEIYYDAKIVKTVTLKAGYYEKFAVPGQPNVILEVNDKKIRFLESTCRDKICINSGYLSRPGEMAACLPNRVAVKIVDSGKASSDRADTYIK